MKPQFQPTPTGKPIDPVWRYKIECGFFRKFTWKERLKIALGMAVKVDMKIGLEQRPGKFSPIMGLYVTKQTEAEAFQKGQRSYRCRHCNLWHRTSGITKLLNLIRRKNVP